MGGSSATTITSQVYLLYLSLTAVGIVVLLTVSLSCSLRRRRTQDTGTQQYRVEDCTIRLHGGEYRGEGCRGH